ncbi:MAG: hypothetical protein QOE53_2787 [Pseudonocardiales bacterium]|nr:hypothetical protein [Pseudonocardiales bacterium]
MSATQVPENFWVLADPSQEVLIDGRPAFSQLGPVPLPQLGGDPMSSGELRQADVDINPER